MWLYLPSTCCPSAPASGCSTLPLMPHSSILDSDAELSVTSSGKSMRPRNLSRLWKLSASTRRLSGLTLEPSTADRGAASWIASLEACRASPTALQGSKPETPTIDRTATVTDPFQTSFASSMSVDPPWLSSRTYLPGFEPDSSDLLERNYADWVTHSLIRSSSLRRTLAQRINGNGASYWPSTRSEDGESCGNHPGAVDSQVEKWATPKALSGGANSKRDERGSGGADLQEQIKRWPTPAARDEKGGGNMTERADGKSRMDMLDWRAEAFSRPVQSILDGQELSPTTRTLRPRLNPAFAAWLMGLCGWWTSPAVTNSAQSEMAAYRSKLQSELSRLCGE